MFAIYDMPLLPCRRYAALRYFSPPLLISLAADAACYADDADDASLSLLITPMLDARCRDDAPLMLDDADTLPMIFAALI